MPPPEVSTKPEDCAVVSPSAATPWLTRVLRRIRAMLYNEQVTMLLPTRRPTPPRPLTADHILRSAQAEDYPDWISLLNADEGFGHWDDNRLCRDLIGKLLRPDSSVLLFRGGKLIGCAAMCIGDYKGRLMPTGMFLILDAAHRGQFKLSNALYHAVLAHAEAAAHPYTFVSTFPDRLSALALYLSNGAKPVHSNLWSFVQWRGIHRRTGAIVNRLKQRN